MPIVMAAADLALLQAVDTRDREGETVEGIARALGIPSGAPTLSRTVSRLGFRFARQGGLQLVDSLFKRPLAEWVASGELVAEEPEPAPPTPVAA